MSTGPRKNHPARPKTSSAPGQTERSQVMEMFLALAAELGFASDEDVAHLAHVGADNVANWRSGAVREFKPQRLRAAIDSLRFHVRSLRARAGLGGVGEHLFSLHVEEGSTPADLQRQFRERVGYDYLGHRFLYFEPQGALAWENLIRAGYDQDRYLAGIAAAARGWLAPGGPLGGVRARGVDLVSLGSGEGDKDAILLRELLGLALPWIAYAPVDVSIPLLVAAARAAERTVARVPPAQRARAEILPFCADFEEGTLAFLHRLRTASPPFAADGVRLVLILGNVFGNLREEELFVRQKLLAVARPGDLVWIEIALRFDDLAQDPLYRMTLPGYQETATEANRRLLVEGPYRRWTAATGRRPLPEVELRIAVREADDTARIPGSCNFVHDLVIHDERRVCTMLYSRRYRIAPLTGWFERLGFTTEATHTVDDSRGMPRIAHLLLRRV